MQDPPSHQCTPNAARRAPARRGRGWRCLTVRAVTPDGRGHARWAPGGRRAPRDDPEPPAPAAAPFPAPRTGPQTDSRARPVCGPRLAALAARIGLRQGPRLHHPAVFLVAPVAASPAATHSPPPFHQGSYTSLKIWAAWSLVGMPGAFPGAKTLASASPDQQRSAVPGGIKGGHHTLASQNFAAGQALPGSARRRLCRRTACCRALAACLLVGGTAGTRGPGRGRKSFQMGRAIKRWRCGWQNYRGCRPSKRINRCG
jgi:hypothetical protein